MRKPAGRFFFLSNLQQNSFVVTLEMCKHINKARITPIVFLMLCTDLAKLSDFS